MKKIIAIVAFCVVTISMWAQPAIDVSPDKASKKAGRSLSTYNLDKASNADKLPEAKQLIDFALKDAAVQADPSAWLVKGDVYSTIASEDMLKKSLSKEGNYKSQDPKAGIAAYEAYKKAYDIAVKSGDKKEALKGLQSNVPNLNYAGGELFDIKDSKGAYDAFKYILETHKLLTENKMKSPLAKQEDYNLTEYYAAYAASQANMKDDAIALYEELLYKNKYDSIGVYRDLYQLKSEKDAAAGLKVLEEGRKKYPEDLTLLYNEINYYLTIGKLDQLTDKLKSAIAKEPNNISLYTTLGNVYDNLYQKETDAVKAKQYEDEALKYYTQALEKDPKSVDALYSTGALYYNKAAAMTQELKKLESDYSSAGLKKFEAKNKEVMDMFEKALPFFQKAESIDPDNRNTLIALKEIYARKNDLEKSNEYKVRLQKQGQDNSKAK